MQTSCLAETTTGRMAGSGTLLVVVVLVVLIGAAVLLVRQQRRGIRNGAGLVVTGALLASVLSAAPAQASGIVTPPADLALSEQSLEVGDRLRINGGTWTPQNAVVDITWFVDGVEVIDPAEAVDPYDLQLLPAWLGSLVIVEIRGTAPGYLPSTTILRPSSVGTGWWSADFPRLPIEAWVGEPYTVPLPTGLPADVTIGVRWHLDGELIAGAAGATYTPTPDQAQRAFGVSVVLTRPGYQTLSAGGGVRLNPSPDYRFADYRPSDPFHREVTWAVDSRTMTDGKGQMFYPARVVNRAQAAEYLQRVSLKYLAAPTCPPGTPRMFTDVPIDHPQCAAIETLASSGVITGWPDGTFRPEVDVSRQAMATFMFRLTGATGQACSGTRFRDVGPAHPFCKEIEFLASQGIINGYADGTFGVGKNITRHAAAAFLHRFNSTI